MKRILITLAVLLPIYVWAYDPAEKEMAICAMLEANGYHVRFDDEVPKMLQFVKDNSPKVPDEKLKALREELTFDRFARAMASVVGAFMTQADVEATNAFLSRGGGRKEAEFMVRLYVEIRDGKETVQNIASRRDKFYLALTEDERSEIRLFRDGDAGKHYWKMLAQVEKQYRPLCGKVLGEAMKEVNRRGQPQSPNKSLEPTARAVTP